MIPCAGRVKLENVFLKSTAFDALGLPLTVVQGSVHLIEFDIPWKTLGSDPVFIRIKELKVLLGPNSDPPGDYFLVIRRINKKSQVLTQYLVEDASQWSEKRIAARIKRLSNDLESRKKALATKAVGDSFTSRLITSVLDNLIVEVEGFDSQPNPLFFDESNSKLIEFHRLLLLRHTHSL